MVYYSSKFSLDRFFKRISFKNQEDEEYVESLKAIINGMAVEICNEIGRAIGIDTFQIVYGEKNGKILMNILVGKDDILSKMYLWDVGDDQIKLEGHDGVVQYSVYRVKIEGWEENRLVELIAKAWKTDGSYSADIEDKTYLVRIKPFNIEKHFRPGNLSSRTNEIFSIDVKGTDIIIGIA